MLQFPAGEVDLTSPLNVSVEFLPIERPLTSYDGGNPRVLVDYRDVPQLLVEGNTTASVRGVV